MRQSELARIGKNKRASGSRYLVDRVAAAIIVDIRAVQGVLAIPVDPTYARQET